MSSSGVHPADVHNLLQRAAQTRRGFPVHSSEFARPGGTYYAPSIMLPEPRALAQQQMQQDRVSMASATTPMSAIFDDSVEDYSTYSASTAPSQRGPEPPQFQRAAVPDFAASWLPCEFRKLSRCEERFRHDEVEAWIQHMMVMHLRSILPKYCICWFCDHARFQAASERPQDVEAAYRERMRHIASHFSWGKTAAEVRWDYFFLDHVYRNGLITKGAYDSAKRESEVRLPRDMTFGSPRNTGHGQAERRRHHGQARDSTRSSHPRRDR